MHYQRAKRTAAFQPTALAKSARRVRQLPIIAALVLSSAGACAQTGDGALQGFGVSRHWDEQVKEFTYEPGVRVQINAPSAVAFDPRKRTQVIVYALPNGNSIEWTVGRKEAQGLDWHFYIQHIGAQVRRLREVIKDYNIVVAYLETERKSWPAWRRAHPQSSALITKLLVQLRRQIGVDDARFVLSAHSGGGSFIFGYLNGVERIADDITRIAFLDANYGFSADSGHRAKLLEWLSRQSEHCLTVLAYDDREITLQGKKVVGPTGGTYRATGRMLESFQKEIELAQTTNGDCRRYRALNGRIDVIVHQNPDNRILHTVLVGDMNGFIHALTSGTKFEDRAGTFGGPVAYERWIQAD